MFGLDILLKSAGMNVDDVKKLSTQVAQDFAEILATTRENKATLAQLQSDIADLKAQSAQNVKGE